MSESRGTSHAFDDLVEESLDEATFLWGRWEAELTSLTRNLDEVWSWTEDRLLGAMDGVRLAGPAQIEMAGAGLQSDEVHRVTVCAAILGSSRETGTSDTLAAALITADDRTLDHIIRGLEVCGTGPALRKAGDALVAREATGALCRLKSFHRAPVKDEIARGLASRVTSIKIEAIKACTHSSPEVEETIAAAMKKDEAEVRAAAVESGLRRGMPDAWTAVSRAGRLHDATAAPYLKWLAALGESDDHEAVFAALSVPALQTSAIWALGHVGTARAVELCLRGMKHETTARGCGEVYCWITGADLSRDGLEKRETPPETPSFEDDNLDADLVPTPEAFWPLPDADAVREHWADRAPSFVPESRYIHGRPVTPDFVASMVETGPMLRRSDLVSELAFRTRGRYDVETRALTVRQRHMMTASRSALSAGDGR